MSTPRRRAPRMDRRTIMTERSWTWQEQASCRRKSNDLFYGPEGEKPLQRESRESRAVEICADCPVREACLTHALSVPEAYGVWGGTTESARLALRRRRASAA